MQSSNTLNPLPVPLKKRRTTRRRTRTPTRRANTSKPEKECAQNQLFSSLLIHSDTRVALRVLREDWCEAANQDIATTPPVLLLSQLSSLVSNKTELYRELDVACLEGLRRILLPSNDEAFVTPEDFRDRAANPDSEVLQKFFADVFKTNHLHWISLYELKDIYGQHTETSVNKLIRSGYLTFRDENSYNFAVPGMGSFMRNREAGTKQIVAILKRTPYKEMGVTKLELRTLKGTCFTARWHVRDIVGSGRVECLDTSVGMLIRLRI